jgi:hypothetical protein
VLVADTPAHYVAAAWCTDGALHGEVAEGTKREAHGGLAREAYCRRGVNDGARQAWGGMVVLIGGSVSEPRVRKGGCKGQARHAPLICYACAIPTAAPAAVLATSPAWLVVLSLPRLLNSHPSNIGFLFAPPDSLVQQLPDHILHSVSPHLVPALT